METLPPYEPKSVGETPFGSAWQMLLSRSDPANLLINIDIFLRALSPGNIERHAGVLHLTPEFRAISVNVKSRIDAPGNALNIRVTESDAVGSFIRFRFWRKVRYGIDQTAGCVNDGDRTVA